MRALFTKIIDKIKKCLKKLSFKTGIFILALCIPCYIISFAQMALHFSYTVKGVLWVIFFGFAKLFQYTGLAIIGVEGVKRLKSWWFKLNKKNISEV